MIAAATTMPDNLIRTTAQSAAAQSASGSLDVTRVLGALLLVLAAIWLLKWAARKMLALPSGGKGDLIRVISRTAISPKQHVLAIAVGERVLIVADNGQQLTTLCEIDDAQEVRGMVGEKDAIQERPSPRRSPVPGEEVMRKEVRELLDKVGVSSGRAR